MIISNTLIIPVVAITTVATAIFIGLGFLPRPSRAGALWSAGFAIAMTATYVWVGSEVLDSTRLRTISIGLLFGAFPLMWSGLRAFRGKEREYLWISLPILFLLPATLYLATYTPYYGITFRAMFAAMGIFAALTIAELLGLGPALRDEVLPLVLATSIYLVFIVVVVIEGVMVARGTISNADSLTFIRSLNMIGVNILVVCYLVTALMLATRADAVGRSVAHAQFQSVSMDRLARAEAVGDPWWSLLDIRLDNPDDIRAASSTADFNKVSERFVERIRTHLPADADIEIMDPTRVIVLVPRAQGGLREILSSLLRELSVIDPDQPVPLALSASIGWAQVTSVGYDLDDLITAAAGAVMTARENGGDRWERVRGKD